MKHGEGLRNYRKKHGKLPPELQARSMRVKSEIEDIYKQKLSSKMQAIIDENIRLKTQNDIYRELLEKNNLI
jgi:hypothetical protein